MKRQLKSIRILSFFFCSFNLVALVSCKLFFLPAYNAQLSNKIDVTSKAVDTFYSSMLDSTSISNDGRAYSKFADQYLSIETDLNSLLTKNTNRPLNANSNRICQITLQLWVKYKEEHKKSNTLSDGIIKLNQKTFSDLFNAMQVAEKGKAILNSL